MHRAIYVCMERYALYTKHPQPRVEAYPITPASKQPLLSPSHALTPLFLPLSAFQVDPQLPRRVQLHPQQPGG